MPAVSKIKIYYNLTKPGIIRGNAITTGAGFLLASKTHIHFGPLLAVLIGSSLVIASGCVYNNYIDRDIDKRMARTSKRALVQGTVSGRDALIYATLLGLAGFFVLAAFTNLVTVLIGIVGIFFYVVVYGIAKRKSVHGTVVGSISGAVPPVAGYTAATGQLDIGAFLLFLILVFWQMPHFYAIATYRKDDYAAASIPVLPIVKGLRATKVQIISYIIGFMIAVGLLTGFGYTGYSYLVIMAILSSMWLLIAWRGLKLTETEATNRWARSVFGFSLLVLLVFSATISLESLLP